MDIVGAIVGQIIGYALCFLIITLIVWLGPFTLIEGILLLMVVQLANQSSALTLNYRH